THQVSGGLTWSEDHDLDGLLLPIRPKLYARGHTVATSCSLLAAVCIHVAKPVGGPPSANRAAGVLVGDSSSKRSEREGVTYPNAQMSGPKCHVYDDLALR